MEQDNDSLPKIFATLHKGGKKTLIEPPRFACSDRTHTPFRITNAQLVDVENDELLISGIVRTAGIEFDGDRSDLHQSFGLVWAAILRAFGISSPYLSFEPHMFTPGEIGAAHLAFTQSPWNLDKDNIASGRSSMNAWTAFIFHLLEEVFCWRRVNSSPRPDPGTTDFTEPSWIEPILKNLRSPADASVLNRRFPLWQYFSSLKRGVTVLRMPRIRVCNLRMILAPYAPSIADGEESLCLLANGLPNAVSYNTLKRGLKVLSLSGDKCDQVIPLPIDSHCLFIGGKTIVAIEDYCGKDRFNVERDRMLTRRSKENDVFFTEASVSWNTPLNAVEFENLCLDLVKREPGVIRAKPVGTTNDRDGGRDILVTWIIPTDHTTDAVTEESVQESAGRSRSVDVICQVKSHSKTIGKRDVQDIRDMLDHHGADGFLLIAYPRISSALVDHMENLRRNTTQATDWWDAEDLEERLRRHPDIARKYPDLVTLTLS